MKESCTATNRRNYTGSGSNGNNLKTIKPMAKTISIGRDARTGRFIPIKEAERRPSITVVEKVKVGPVKHRNK